MQSHISPLKRQSLNEHYPKQNTLNRRSVYANRFHSPIVSNHIDLKTHKKLQNQENHLGNSLEPNVEYLVIKRVNSPTHRNRCFEEKAGQVSSNQNSESSEDKHRVLEELPQKYEYFVRYAEYPDNDKNMSSKNKNKTKIKAANQKENYESNYLRVMKNDSLEEQTLELEDSFEEEERLRNNHQKEPQAINTKDCFRQKTKRKSQNKEKHFSRRRSTNDYLETPKREDYEEESEYLVIKKKPRLSSRNTHFVEFGRLSKESKDILENVERFYSGDSEDSNDRYIGEKSKKHFGRILSEKRPFHHNWNNYDYELSIESEEVKRNPHQLQSQIKARIKDIENIIETENENLKDHNHYLLATIKKMQLKDRNQRIEIQKQATKIQKLVEERNAYMERCLQLQHFSEGANKDSLDHYLQNSTTVDSQNETLNATQSKNKERLEELRRHLHSFIQSSAKQAPNKNDEYNLRKQHHVPTPKFSSNRESPEHVRKIQLEEEKVLFGDETSQMVGSYRSRDQEANTNNRFNGAKSLSNNTAINFEAEEVSEEEDSSSESNESESRMARYNTEPPNTPLPLCLSNRIYTLNDQFNSLMKEYKSTRDAKIRKQCVNLALKIKELSRDEDMISVNSGIEAGQERRGLKKMESLEMEIEENRAKYCNEETPYDYCETSRLR